MFITFEGLDYSGKSTQATLLVERLSRKGANSLLLREPGGTEIGERIRSILLDKEAIDMTNIGEMLLFSASRAQLVEEVIRPALEGNVIVVCDRFYDSTTAYQGWGRGIPLDAVHAINRLASGGLVPDLTFYLDLPVDEVERRLRGAPGGKDRMESNGREFYERVRNGYLEMAGKEARYVIVNGMEPIDVLEDQVWQNVEPKIADVLKV